MIRYVVRRLAQAIPLVVLISAVIFLLLKSVPGGPLAAYAENPNITPQDLARLEQQYGLDRPIPLQYLSWAGDWIRGDWGYSNTNRRPVIELIGGRLGNTLTLMVASTLLTLVVAVPIAMLSAYRQYSWFDHFATLFAFAGISLPTFWFGLLLIILFGSILGWLPMGGVQTLGAEGFDLGDRLRHLVLPAVTLAILSAGSQVRYLRASILDTLHADYVRTAYAKGLGARAVMLKHVFKNAASPLVTNLAADIPDLFTGALVTETIFSWPGMGRLYWEAATGRDYAVLMSLLTIAAIMVVLSYLAADVAYGALDPRIRFSGRGA